MLHVRRVRLVVPIPTSRVRFDAAYLAPLLEARFRPALPDMSQKIEVSDIPENLRTPANVWRSFASVDEEMGRVREEFRDVVDQYNRPVIEVIYPGDELRKVILAEVERAEEAMEQTADVMLVPEEIAGLAAKGLTDEHRRLLVAHGYNNLGQIAGTPPDRIAALPNIGLLLARRIVESASKTYVAVVPKSAAEVEITVPQSAPAKDKLLTGSAYSSTRRDKPSLNALA